MLHKADRRRMRAESHRSPANPSYDISLFEVDYSVRRREGMKSAAATLVRVESETPVRPLAAVFAGPPHRGDQIGQGA